MANTIESLIAALKDENRNVRANAAKVLGQIGDSRAVEPLFAALKDKDVFVRVYSVEALGKIGKPAVELLIAALKDKDELVQKGAAMALVEIGKPAVEPLIAAFPLNSAERSAADRILSSLSDPKLAVNVLCKKLVMSEEKKRATLDPLLGSKKVEEALHKIVVGLFFTGIVILIYLIRTDVVSFINELVQKGPMLGIEGVFVKGFLTVLWGSCGFIGLALISGGIYTLITGRAAFWLE